MPPKFKDGVPAQYQWARQSGAKPKSTKCRLSSRSCSPSPGSEQSVPVAAAAPKPVLVATKPAAAAKSPSPTTRSTASTPPLSSAGRATAAAPTPSKPKPKAKPTIRSLRKPKPFVPPSASRPPLRPSLKDQLSAVADAAGSITSALAEKHGLTPDPTKHDDTILVVPARAFVVGRLESKFPSPVRFQAHRCVYQFHHPYEKKQITMEMYYTDMSQVRLAGRTLTFKVGAPLDQFGSDYRPSDRRHVISIGLASGADEDALRSKVMHKIQRRK